MVEELGVRRCGCVDCCWRGVDVRTGIGGPIGGAMIAGALMGAGRSIWSEKSETGTVDWGKVAVDGAIGAGRV